MGTNTSRKPKIVLKLLDSNLSGNTKKRRVIKMFNEVRNMILKLDVSDVLDIICI